MKDFRLSEIKEICKNGGCCPLIMNCGGNRGNLAPSYWEIEPRDMIELPCKIPLALTDGTTTFKVWQLVYRGNDGRVIERIYTTEIEANKALQELKGEKR